MKFNLFIFSYKKTYFLNKVNCVNISSMGINIDIYANHIPILSLIKYAILYIFFGKKKKIFYISNGILEFSANKLTILIKNIIKPDILSKKNVLKIKKNILYKLNKMNIKNIDNYLKLNNKLFKYNKYLTLIKLIQIQNKN